ncbi:hypothetical protein [Deinococcus roseus]|uniref:DUF3592 domain-containing protein n=1 Tax=Deinococcus roseus TaxID=392414 RepID=A0ABQ2D5W3_9DEIO|nr:hypothetical protein [Deinococcus roseus]GGJ44693.1 hypothetical protein GCM10008938_33590 [Deinococcus roseus]
MEKLKLGRPGPSGAQQRRTLQGDQARRIWYQNPLPYWRVWINVLVFVGMCMPLLYDQLTFTFSPRHLETTTVVRVEQRGKGGTAMVAILNIHGQDVAIYPPLDPGEATVGEPMTVVCTPQLVCRKNDPWSQNYLYVMLVPLFLVSLLLIVPLLVFRARVRS